jgi:hypothetical protein
VAFYHFSFEVAAFFTVRVVHIGLQLIVVDHFHVSFEELSSRSAGKIRDYDIFF